MGLNTGGSFWAYVKADVWFIESKLKKKPLPRRFAIENWTLNIED